MQFLKTLLIVFTAGLAVAFAFNNWTAVDVRLWGGLLVDINLPLLLAICFLLGLVPTYMWQRARRWRVQTRLAASERTVADLRAAIAAVPPPAVPAPATAPLPDAPVEGTAPATADTPVSALPADPIPPPAAPPLIDGARP